MKSLQKKIDEYVSQGFTVVQARYHVAQQIILSKIEKSNYIDKTLLKGGIVMYNMTQEQRRTTSDLDLDFIRLDISKEQNIQKFIDTLNKYESSYHISLDNIRDLNQHDYKGKGLKLSITDDFGSRPIKFSIDIGVHTLLGIEQEKMCFVFNDGERCSLWVNPPEQIFAEKLLSLAKIGPTSSRYRDIDDMYYLITKCEMDKEILKNCLSLLTIDHPYNIMDMTDIINRVNDCLNNELFISGFQNHNNLWLDVNYDELKETILNYLFVL